MKISVLIGTRNRTEPLLRCIESVLRQARRPDEILVLDDASNDVDVAACLREAGRGFGDARVLRSAQQLGVGPGRNLLMSAATGDVFFVLDDDARLESPDILGRLERAFDAHPEVGIIAGRIRDHREDRTRDLIPFPRRARRRSADIAERPQLTSYFLGGAHAVRRSLYERTGGYDNHFVWGEEELDLSFRAIQAGFEILYTPEVVAHHYPSPSVLRHRDDERSELFYHSQNRVLLARRYLPLIYVIPYLFIWITRYIAAGARQGALRDVARGVRTGIRFVRHAPRTPLRGAALAYARRNHGRLWF